jgi:hypothetical protein
MIELNKTYQKKENIKVKVKPHEIKNGRVGFSHVGYFDCRSIPIEGFLERYELEPEE